MNKKYAQVEGKAVKPNRSFSTLTPRQKFAMAYHFIRCLHADGSGRNIYELMDSLRIPFSNERYFKLAESAYFKRISNRNCGSYFFHLRAVMDKCNADELDERAKRHLAFLTRRGRDRKC